MPLPSVRRHALATAGRLAAALLVGGCSPLPSELDGGVGPGDAAPEATFALRLFPDAQARNLVCNDGSPAGYYLRRGGGLQSRRWVIYLQGGIYCHDLPSCQRRWSSTAKELMTSQGWAPTIADRGGILTRQAANNPDFADANQVFVPYCSSDLWSGDRAASADTGNWHFRGQLIFQAVLEDLLSLERTGAPNLGDAQEAVLAGSSAGGLGVLVNADAFASRLPGVRAAVLDDAGWFLDLPPFQAGQPAMRDKMNAGMALWNGQPDPSCAQQNAAAPWLCYLGDVARPFIAAPLFGYIGQRDQALLNEVGGAGLLPPSSPDQLAYVATFQSQQKALMGQLEGAFCPNVTVHTAAGSPDFFGITVDGQDLRGVFGNWFFQRAGTKKLIQEP